jgi:hypothetical protein
VTVFGYTMMREQSAPDQLVSDLLRAEEQQRFIAWAQRVCSPSSVLRERDPDARHVALQVLSEDLRAAAQLAAQGDWHPSQCAGRRTV